MRLDKTDSLPPRVPPRLLFISTAAYQDWGILGLLVVTVDLIVSPGILESATIHSWYLLAK